jgi:hypothetical protein
LSKLNDGVGLLWVHEIVKTNKYEILFSIILIPR